MMYPRLRILVCSACLLAVGLLPAASAWAQVASNAADLAGVVTDPSGSRIPGATVTVRSLATNQTRIVTTDADGAYNVLALPPGKYEVTVEAAGFDTLRNPELELQIGSRSTYNIELRVRTGQETVVVTADSVLIETQRTAVTETISARKIENLPINQRDYLNFTLLTSNAARDSAPSIGAAPTSGLNFGGQRGRSNQVSVDGADATDNSVNGVRATVSQEAVQEFQLITNSYNPEFGRASGAIINIVTKGGANDLHGNIFGFIRNKEFDADNPFSTVADPAFTRFQGGFTIGGPITRDRTFYFLSYERRQRREEGFSSIGQDNFGLVAADFSPFIPVPVLVTPEQEQFVNGTLATAAQIAPIDPVTAAQLTQVAVGYAALVGTWSFTALNGVNPGFLDALLGVPLGGTPTFFDGIPLPASYTSLNALRGNYPLTEDTDFYSARIDHQWNENNNFFIRGSATPSDITGIQVNAQNQTFGQNSFSRSSEQFVRDWSVVAQNVTAGSSSVNEARVQVARRGLSYTPASFPGGTGEALGGEGPGVNIGGFAFFGREPFARVDRVERRYQFTDNFTLQRGSHTYKFGGDLNYIQIRPRLASKQVFELNFGAVINFGALGASSSVIPVAAAIDPALAAALEALGAPPIIAVQSYGFGVPSTFIQGIGDSFSSINNTAFAFYAQDSWRITPNITLNYGIRWDGERTPILPAFNDLTAQSEAELGVTEGIPRDWDNWAPRVGLAWAPGSDGRTVVRAAYGLFYDHPLLAVAFNADTADGAQSTQQILFGGSPCSPALSVTVNPACLNATNVFRGTLNAPASFGYLPSEQRFNAFPPDSLNSIFVNQNFCAASDATRQCALGFPISILPWTLPVAADFEYGYAQQWNLTFEREIVPDFSVSVAYLGVKGTHLNRPRNINVADPAILVANLDVALQSGLLPAGSDPRQVQLPAIDPSTGTPFAPNSCVNTAGGGSVVLTIPGVFGAGFDVANCGLGLVAPVGFIGSAAAFNFFRPTGPNFALTGGIGVPDAAILQVAALAGYPTGPGFFVPFSDVNQQESTGSSIYHGMTVNMRKRYSNHYEFLASYTWSHAIDDSTDLQTLLNPQDNSRPDLERANSTFDLRQRFVFSAVFESPYSQSDDGALQKFLANWTISPIFEASSGRPFTVLTGADVNLDFGANTERPSLAAGAGTVSSPFLPGVAFGPQSVCPATSTVRTLPFGCSGNLGRNTFTRPNIYILDLRVSRKIDFNERWNLELMADIFNMFNRFNVADVNPLCDPIGGRCIAGQPTAAFDARQIQFGVKLRW